MKKELKQNTIKRLEEIKIKNEEMMKKIENSILLAHKKAKEYSEMQMNLRNEKEYLRAEKYIILQHKYYDIEKYCEFKMQEFLKHMLQEIYIIFLDVVKNNRDKNDFESIFEHYDKESKKWLRNNNVFGVISFDLRYNKLHYSYDFLNNNSNYYYSNDIYINNIVDDFWNGKEYIYELQFDKFEEEKTKIEEIVKNSKFSFESDIKVIMEELEKYRNFKNNQKEEFEKFQENQKLELIEFDKFNFRKIFDK